MDAATTADPGLRADQRKRESESLLHSPTPISNRGNGTTELQEGIPIDPLDSFRTTHGSQYMSPLLRAQGARSHFDDRSVVADVKDPSTRSYRICERPERVTQNSVRFKHRNEYPKLRIGPLADGVKSAPLPSDVASSPTHFDTDSPISSSSPASDGDSVALEYDTPMTSPCTSPAKGRHHSRRSAFMNLEELVDGADDIPDFSADDDECTPDVSPTKPATGYPFPGVTGQATKASPLSRQRHPSALLQYCERNVSPRQRRLMAGTLQTADRFIAARANTPTKEALLLRKCGSKLATINKPSNIEEMLDPFGAIPSRSARTTERYATLRRMPARERQHARLGTVVPDVPTNRRAVSAGAVWTVGGTVVTEGVASITNGRGGRITSSTSAPHYTSDFLHRQSPSEDERQHGRRLAIAMDVSQSARMLIHSSPSSPMFPSTPRRSSCGDTSRSQTYWNNCAWEKEKIAAPSKKPSVKTKAIPIVPFRVLDAPALRDDYYCSLLAYSDTMRCLAVGLGPHVYLWSESRRTTPTHIPDSLTAPFASHVTSVSFSSTEGGSGILAIGRADGRITLWSPLDREPRFDSEQPAPVSCVSFRPNTVKRQSIREPAMTSATEELLVGDEAGHVYYYSVEWPTTDQRDLFGWHGSMTLLARISCHTQQVCGIAWSREGEHFATGGNDNQLYLFETKRLFERARVNNPQGPSVVRVRNGNESEGGSVAGQGGVLDITQGQQRHLFALNAAVKAISFAPWQASLIAAGGGSNDRCIHFFHAVSGATLATIDCHAQITSLVWSEKKKEIAATFGFAQPEHPYRVAVFAWPSCRRLVGIPWWSEERALYAVAYPGGPSGGPDGKRTTAQAGQRERPDSEGRPWYGRRTRDEGCLVIATSDASIKFHEIWTERCENGKGRKTGGVFGGSQILEDGVSEDIEREATIR